MGTPLKSLSVLLSPRVLSPLAPLPGKSPRQLLVPRVEDIKPKTSHFTETKGVNRAVKHLEFSKLSPSSKPLFEPTKVQISEYIDNESDVFNLRKNDLDIVINTPNKINILKTGLKSNKYLNILGTGRFGKVVRGIHKDKIVAVKVVRSTDSLREKNALNLNHINIVKTIDIVENKCEKFSLIVMEYLPNSRQLQFLLEDQINLEDKLIAFAKQLSQGVEYCHENRILHLDIKPQNILVCGDICKLCDFGNSVTKSDATRFIHQGTVPYTAPELLQGRRPTEKCDIYSLGIVFWQMRFRCCPYSEMDNTETVIYKVVKCNWRPENTPPSDGFSKLYQKCWSANPEDRPSVYNILKTLSPLYVI